MIRIGIAATLTLIPALFFSSSDAEVMACGFGQDSAYTDEPTVSDALGRASAETAVIAPSVPPASVSAAPSSKPVSLSIDRTLALLSREIEEMPANSWREIKGPDDRLVFENYGLSWDVADQLSIDRPALSGIATAGDTSRLIDTGADFSGVAINAQVRHHGTGEVVRVKEVAGSHELVLKAVVSQRWAGAAYSVEGINLNRFGGSRSVLKAWNGGAWDPDEYVFYVFGGGHGDYGGNEVYRVDLKTLSAQRITDPDVYDLWAAEKDNKHGNWTVHDGIEAPHTYDGLVWSSGTGTLISLSDMGVGGGGPYNWLGEFDPARPGWVRHGAVNEKVFTYPISGYRKSNGKIYVLNVSAPWRNSQGPGLSVVDPVTKDTRHLATAAKPLRWGNGIIVGDEGRDYLYFTQFKAPWGAFARWQLDAPYDLEVLTLSAEAAPWVGQSEGPGLAYRPDDHSIYLWSQHKEIYQYRISDNSWTIHTPPSGPSIGSGSDNGVYGRWAYVPALDAFVGINTDATQGIWVYKPK